MKLGAFLISTLFMGIVLTSCRSSLPSESERNIRQRILQNTPIGSDYAVVLDYAKKSGWSVTEEPRAFETKTIAQFPAKEVGGRVIEAYLGGYQGVPWKKDVNFYWAFDEHDKLIEVFVEKQADAL
jgi:hypothetical protein